MFWLEISKTNPHKSNWSRFVWELLLLLNCTCWLVLWCITFYLYLGDIWDCFYFHFCFILFILWFEIKYICGNSCFFKYLKYPKVIMRVFLKKSWINIFLEIILKNKIDPKQAPKFDLNNQLPDNRYFLHAWFSFVVKKKKILIANRNWREISRVMHEHGMQNITFYDRQIYTLKMLFWRKFHCLIYTSYF